MSTPALPPAGTSLNRDAAAAIAAELDAWVAAVASELLDLEQDAQASGTDAQRADVAAAFALWRAVSERTERWDGVAGAGGGERAAALASAWSPITSDAGEVLAPDLADAMAFLAALVERLRTQLESERQQAASTAEGWLSLDEDLRHAAQAASRLGQEVRHVAELEAEAGRHSRSVRPPADLATRASAARVRLDAAEAERERLLVKLDTAVSLLADLAVKEAAVRTLADTCRAKIAGAPPLAVPSVAAIDPPPDGVRDRPWPAVEAPVRAWLQQTDRVGAALDEAARRFQAPLTRRDELRGLLQGFRDKAASAGLAEHEALDPLYTVARDTLWSAPCDVASAESQVDDYVRTVNTMMHGVG